MNDSRLLSLKVHERKAHLIKSADGEIKNLSETCQVCKHHENKPSRCIRYEMNVGRKELMPCNEPDSVKQARRGAHE